MSRNDAISPRTRLTSSRTNGDGSTDNNNDEDDDVSGGSIDSSNENGLVGRTHDHTRPFPPPRLPAVHVSVLASANVAPSAGSPTSSRRGPSVTTAPLTPLPTNTFRSRPRTTNVDTGNANDTPPRSPIGEVSLTVPRPDGERAINEYVEAPFKHTERQQERNRRAEDESGKRVGNDCPKIDRRQNNRRKKGVVDVAATHRLHANRTQTFGGIGGGTGSGSVAAVNASPLPAGSILTPDASVTSGSVTGTVTKQPVSFTKEPANSVLSAPRTFDPAGLSIMCNFCGRCRCESCREPPPLPSKWLCDNKCFCSADTILDYASCLCCVKGLFYHCADGSNAGGGIDGEAAGSCADEPCSCTGNRVASRWACLGALTLLMPCLLCYWPFKGCVRLCEICYARHAAQGCRCNPNATSNTGSRHHPIANDIGDSRDPEKRLLDPVTPEL